MTSQLPHLEQRRTELYDELAEIGDFRRGSVSATYRRCGKANCVCSDPAHPGHGPRHLLTRSVDGRTEARQVASGPELDKVEREVATHKAFLAQVRAIVEVNEAICEARPISPLAGAGSGTEGREAKKGGSARRSRRSSPRR